MRIVVMGGSFNPPTIAHLKMMRSALDQLDAEKGFFVPQRTNPFDAKSNELVFRMKQVFLKCHFLSDTNDYHLE